MTRLLPALYEGHAPFYLHQAFADAVDAYQEWSAGADEPLVAYDGRLVPISSIFGRMRRCTDLLPVRVFEDVAALQPDGPLAELTDTPTYADAAYVMRALCVERLRAERAAAVRRRH
jgi:hypothetical protein